MNAHLRNLAGHRLPVAKIAERCLPETGNYPQLSTPVTHPVKPSDKLLGLADDKHDRTVSM